VGLFSKLFGGDKKEAEDDFDKPPTAEKVAAAQAEWKAAWEQAQRSNDDDAFYAALSAAKRLVDDAWLFDEAFAHLAALGERFPQHRGNTEQEIATNLYLGKAGYRQTLSDDAKAKIYEQALGHYVLAARHGDLFGSLNYWEMCEWLADCEDYPVAKVIEHLKQYQAIYPEGEELDRVEDLLDDLQNPDD
jgi:hypothetical protein